MRNTWDIVKNRGKSDYEEDSSIREIAEQENCYKMMLLTGSKRPETLHFMRKQDITALTRQLLFSGWGWINDVKKGICVWIRIGQRKIKKFRN